MLDIQSLSKTYGKICGVKDISFTLSKGEIVGFIGPNGAGKSTTMNMISGCLAPTSGGAEADGVLLRSDPVVFKAKIGYLPERPPLYTEFTVREYLLTVAKFKKGEGKIGLDELINKFGLKGVEHRVIGNLSKGYKQRIGLAQAFVGNSDYIILDEPTVGLDPAQKKQTLELIKMVTDKPYRIAGNVINTGLITNLPQNACVEVPCMVDSMGIHPTYVGDLPEQLAAMNRTNINPQLLTIEAAVSKKKSDIYRAAMLDPHTAAELSIDDIVAMCDEMVEAHQAKGYMKEYK